ETIDSTDTAGQYTSIATDSNKKIHISYYDATNDNLKYATNSSGSWVTSTIDSTDSVGEYTSIAIDSNNRVHISYYDSTNSALKRATNADIPTGTISINSGATYTTSTSVTLTISASGPNGVSQMCIGSTSDISSCSGWETYSTSKSWTLSSGDGSKKVYAWFKDSLGNANSTPYSDSITLDTTSPSGSISINSGTSYTNTTSATLTISASDSYSGVYQMCISNTNSSCTSWETYATSKTWTLSSGSDGYKYVYIWFKDNQGNTNSSPYSDSIYFDTTAPTGSVTINSGASYTNTTSATLTISASDGSGSGVYQMCISNTTSCSSWENYTTSKSWTLSSGDGTKTVYIWFKDNLGYSNSSPYSDTIVFDTTAPTNGTLSATAGDAQISLNWSGFSDATSGLSSYKVVYSTSSTAQPSSCSSGTSIYSGSNTSYTHSSLTKCATYYYRVCAVDNASNTSTGATANALPQCSSTTVPSGSISINNGATYTNSTSVTLNLSASDDTGVTGYYLSTSSTTPSSSASGWTTVTSTTSYSASVSYTPSSGDGTKTVYVWYKDSAGNVSSTCSDSITLDATAPTNGTLTATAGNAQVSLSWSGFSDTTSGLSSYKVVYSTSSTPSSCSSGTSIYSGTNTSYEHTGLSNGTTYYYRACAVDNAGNTSTGATASAQPKGSDIDVTLTPPSNTTVSKGSKVGPFSISIKNNTSSSYSFYTYVYLVTPDETWKSLITKSLTLSAGGTLSANNLYMNIPSSASTGTYYYWVGIYDTSYNLLDYDYFAFTVTSSTSKSGTNNDWGVSGW
ncbi:MAG: hypothetical protein HY754_02855, partial [Nitrospirae bacterium]|nr:hypothetical protein [Nitrospirota bacterium]